jgi:hypothetical protein
MLAWFFLLLFSVTAFAVPAKGDSTPLEGPGTIFIHQSTPNLKTYLSAFLSQTASLKDNSFSAYCLDRDLYDPHKYILVLKCSDLGKGVHFIRSSKYMSVIDRSGARLPMIWYGLDHNSRNFTDQSRMTGGLVIARNEVRNYPFWLKCFYAEDGGKHNHPGRHYKNSEYSIHHLPGDPAVAIVVHEASDVSKAPPFMVSDPLKNEMEATGVTALEVWYGINLQEGVF